METGGEQFGRPQEASNEKEHKAQLEMFGAPKRTENEEDRNLHLSTCGRIDFSVRDQWIDDRQSKHFSYLFFRLNHD